MTKDYDPSGDPTDGEDELRMAARAGILLLEQNAELETTVETLNTELLRYQHQYRELAMEVEVLRDQRKEAVLEVQEAHRDIKHLKSQILHEHCEWERIHDELMDTIDHLRTDLHVAKTTQATADIDNQSEDGSRSSISGSTSYVSSHDAPGVPMVEMDMYDAVCCENAELHAQLRRAHDELAQAQLERGRARALELQAQNLERQVLTVQKEKRALKEEQDEERLLIESLRAMVQTYKKIADSRPFSMECTCALKDTPDDQGDSVAAPPPSLHDDMVQANFALKDEIASLKQQLAAVQALPPPPASDATLQARIADLESRLDATSCTLQHTKQQWLAAVAMQKEAQECCASAQAEISRLNDLLSHQVRHLADPSEPPRKLQRLDGDWVQDHGVHPAPPGDLNSPLIQCLLEHWTRDKVQRRALAEWLQGVVCENASGPPTLRLDRLSSEVSAGFVQLLVPILRQVHGVNVTIMKRASMHVLSDLILDVSKAKVPIATSTPHFLVDRLVSVAASSTSSFSF
ncbi:hypothetical protein ACHHYP_03605 [Achlya hypogyna]|uniref:Uncharacterized protein n=1 Tax=Achlya hypogyna TaxID=1202772 RepID=A0A1V9Z3F4_ACHHY|nr:hypothetical protein ACHHYP_03605 [Achlya hypogyna]